MNKITPLFIFLALVLLALESCSLSALSPNASSSATIKDSRDGQTYKTVVIGTQTWMAQNLNYMPSSGNSWCYSGNASTCETYGRLYDYTKARTVCPTGWHLPDTTEWNTLEAAVGGTATAGTALKSVSGWSSDGDNGTNAYGFSALPTHFCNGVTSSCYVSDDGYWWTATVDGNFNAYYRGMGYSGTGVLHDDTDQSFGFAVRCLKNTP